MERVTGIGGVFFKCEDPGKLKDWYRSHLGVEPDQDGYVSFRWRQLDDPDQKGSTAWNPFPRDTKYFEPSQAAFMINYRVRDLDAMLAQLSAAGATVDEKIEESELGRFGWVMDPDGNRIELWQPPDGE